jgi:hypothetical protein
MSMLATCRVASARNQDALRKDRSMLTTFARRLLRDPKLSEWGCSLLPAGLAISSRHWELRPKRRIVLKPLPKRRRTFGTTQRRTELNRFLMMVRSIRVLMATHILRRTPMRMAQAPSLAWHSIPLRRAISMFRLRPGRQRPRWLKVVQALKSQFEGLYDCHPKWNLSWVLEMADFAIKGASGNSVGLRVKLETAAVEVDRCLEVLAIAKAAR